MTHPTKRLQTVLSLIALGAASAWASETPAPQAVGGKIEWVFDYEEGKKLGRETGKPMFVVFRCER